MSQHWAWSNTEEHEQRRVYQQQAGYFATQVCPVSTTPASLVVNPPYSYAQPPLPSTYLPSMNRDSYTGSTNTEALHSSTSSAVNYHHAGSDYLTPGYGQAYYLSSEVSPGFPPVEYTSRRTSIASGSPSSHIHDDFDDDSLEHIHYTGSANGTHYSSQSSPPHSSHQSADGSQCYMCDHPGCNKVCARLCDLRKHKKRHQKPFPCRDGCDSFFSTEKDRDRHERSKHRREERLTCVVCGHRTARKDNMKDHVRRRHGEENLEQIMDATMANAYPAH